MCGICITVCPRWSIPHIFCWKCSYGTYCNGVIRECDRLSIFQGWFLHIFCFTLACADSDNNPICILTITSFSSLSKSNSFSSLKWLQRTSWKLGSVMILFGWPRMSWWNIFLRKLSSSTRWSLADLPDVISFCIKSLQFRHRKSYQLLIKEWKLT